MTDMNKIKGGTQDQRRIAQERQRAREKKNAQSDPLSKAAPDVKVPQAPTKASAKSDPLAKTSGLAKTTQKALPPSKGGSMVPSKKSQMGKWSQGIKQSPGKLAKKSPTPSNEVNKVKVKDLGNQGTKDNRPGSSKSSPSPSPSKKPTPAKPQQKKKGFKMPKMPKPNLPKVNWDLSTDVGMPAAVGGAKLDGPDKGPADKAKP